MKLLKLTKVLFCVLLFSHIASVAYAQNEETGKVNESEVIDVVIVSDVSNAASMMSAINTGEEKVELVESSSLDSSAAGMCEVVNGLLADFCATYPDDISCQF